MTNKTGSRVSAINLALMARKAREQAGNTLAADPIAIVGMGCRLPGGATDPESFWSFLLESRDAVTPVPDDRWDTDKWHGEGLEAAGRSVAQGAAFLDRVDGFDAEYFGIHPREAEQMDPQQRLFTEVAAEAIEDAGLRFEDLRQSRTGVFAASYHNDYAQMLYRDPSVMDERTLTGTLHSVLANRLSYLFDLRGPSVSVDTACSASLVAVHLACQSLRTGESDIALAGGVSAILAPELMVAMSRLGFLAPDGRCKTFDASADGFGRGEGAGVIVLKRLSDALADNDRVWGVVRGSSVNQDGESTLLAAPNVKAQAALIRDAVSTSQIALDDLVYIETHGTGTVLGDPIEVSALAETIGSTSAGRPECLLGAVKANIGHLEAAAGIVGLIKATLVLSNREVPAQPNFDTLNPHIELTGTRLKVADNRQKLPATVGPPAAGVSSFGVGGTNAHIVLEAAPNIPAETVPSGSDDVQTLVLSARSPAALQDLAASWQTPLSLPEPSLPSLCFTAAMRRTHHRHRLAITGQTPEEIAQKLTRRVDDAGTVSSRSKICFVFCGQGPQAAGMGLDLAETDPDFARHLQRCDAAIRSVAGWSLLKELVRPESESRLADTSIAQPALVALQSGLAGYLSRRGLRPTTVIGHSIGEIAALESAGLISLEEALRVACIRGRIMQEAEVAGGMASVQLNEDAAQSLISRFGTKLSVAAVNAPSETVLSGDSDALDAALDELDAQNVTHRRLPVRYAFHSEHMAGFDARLVDALDSITMAGPLKARILSTVTGSEVDDADAERIARGIRAPVRFADAVKEAASDEETVFLEIGPHPVLGASIAACLDGAGDGSNAIVPTLRRGQFAPSNMADAVAKLYEYGHNPNWAVALPAGGSVTSLPTYPWQHRRHWRQVDQGAAGVAGESTGHPLLGVRLQIATPDIVVFEGGPSGTSEWMQDHKIFGRVIVPGTCALELLAAAAQEVAGPDSNLKNFAMLAPLPIPAADAPPLRWQVVARARDDVAAEWDLKMVVVDETSATAGRTIAEGRSALTRAGALGETSLIDESNAPGADNALSDDHVHKRLNNLGAEFGPAFRLLKDVKARGGVANGTIELPGALAAQAHLMHPSVLDAGLQLATLAADDGGDGLWLPVAADAVYLRDQHSETIVRAEVATGDASDQNLLVSDIVFRDVNDSVIARIEGMRFAKADPASLSAAVAEKPDVYCTAWNENPAPETSERISKPLLLIAPRGPGDKLVAAFKNHGVAARRLDPDASQSGFSSGFEWLSSSDGDGHVLDFSALYEELPPTGMVANGLNRFNAMVAGTAGSVNATIVTQGAFATGAEIDPEAVSVAEASLQAFCKTAAYEHPEIRYHGVDLDPSQDIEDAEILATKLLEFIGHTGPSQIALRGSSSFSPELLTERIVKVSGPLKLAHGDGDGIDGLELVPAARSPLSSGEVSVAVRAAGLNFRDVLSTMGMLDGLQLPLGVEMAGEVIETAGDVSRFKPGDRVFGYAPGAMAEEVVVSAEFLHALPDDVSDVDAAGMTVTFGTALYGLGRLANLKAGETVLIHAGSGGVGQAAIQIALARGAEVFATAGSDSKRAMLKDVGVAHVLDSRSLAFEDQIAKATGGKGVDVVLNSLAGEFIPASVRSLSQNGRFLELGKRELMNDEDFAALRPNASYTVYDLGQSIEANPMLLGELLKDILAGLADGTLRALPTTCFGLDRAGDAMRWMAAARHKGKIVLRVPPRPNGQLRPDATYWVTGGLGGLGLATAQWLARSGAKHILLSGRSAPGDEALAAIAEIEASGTEVRTVQADAGIEADVSDLIQEVSEKMPPLRGVVHAAGTLRDGPVVTRTVDDTEAVLNGKLAGAQIIDRQTRDLPLDFFILYSAAATVLGSPGQSLYVAANAGLDALAEARHKEGLPATSVAWGRWEGAGMAARLADSGQNTWAKRGLGGIYPETGFDPIEGLLAQNIATALVAVVDWGHILATAPSGFDASPFKPLVKGASDSKANPVSASPALRTRLDGLSPERGLEALSDAIAASAIEVIGLSPDTEMDPSQPLKDMGLDSLMAIELRNSLVRQTGLSLSATLLFDFPTLAGLTGHLASELGVTLQDGLAEFAGEPDEDEDLSEVELEAMLEAELALSSRHQNTSRRGRS